MKKLLLATATCLAFDHSQTDRQVITSLWSIFDDPDLNGALDIPQKSPMAIVRRKPNKSADRRAA
jgi:hypothetical protein